jgi:hypothetical protein
VIAMGAILKALVSFAVLASIVHDVSRFRMCSLTIECVLLL